VDVRRLRFLDEAHFVSKNLTNGKVLGMVNQRVWVKQSTLHSKNGTLTILTSLVDDPVVCAYTTDNNSQHSFLDFVVDCCIKGNLIAGDYLVLDNAPVHSNNGVDYLPIVLEFFGVHLIFLPAYSPELNPCELVFNVVKAHVRNYRDGFSPLLDEVLSALATITPELIRKFYAHCIYPGTILPDLVLPGQ